MAQKRLNVSRLWRENISKKGEVIISVFPFGKAILGVYLLNFFLIITILIARNLLPPEIPLFYGMPEGKEQLTSKISLTIPALSSIIFLSVNLILAFFLKDDFTKKTLVVAGLALSFFSTITILKIFSLVGSF